PFRRMSESIELLRTIQRGLCAGRHGLACALGDLRQGTEETRQQVRRLDFVQRRCQDYVCLLRVAALLEGLCEIELGIEVLEDIRGLQLIRCPELATSTKRSGRS